MTYEGCTQTSLIQAAFNMSFIKSCCTLSETRHQVHLCVSHINKSYIEAGQVCVLPTSRTLLHKHTPPTHIRSSHLSVRLYMCSLPQQTVCTLAGNLYLALNFNDRWAAWTQHSDRHIHAHTENELSHSRHQHGFAKYTVTVICLIFFFYDFSREFFLFFFKLRDHIGWVCRSFASHGQNLCLSHVCACVFVGVLVYPTIP